jgi:hypothetical protein
MCIEGIDHGEPGQTPGVGFDLVEGAPNTKLLVDGDNHIEEKLSREAFALPENRRGISINGDKVETWGAILFHPVKNSDESVSENGVVAPSPEAGAVEPLGDGSVYVVAPGREFEGKPEVEGGASECRDPL